VSPGGQTPLLPWCLFSVACADSPAEEEGKRNNRKAEISLWGEVGGKQKKNKVDNKLLKGRKICDKQKGQEWFVTVEMISKSW
jgi:hypothetical protein